MLKIKRLTFFCFLFGLFLNPILAQPNDSYAPAFPFDNRDEFKLLHAVSIYKDLTCTLLINTIQNKKFIPLKQMEYLGVG